MTSNGTDPDIAERAWVGRGWRRQLEQPRGGRYWRNGGTKEKAIQEGRVMAADRRDRRSYKCPLGRPYEWVTYSIVDAMNGMYRIWHGVSRGQPYDGRGHPGGRYGSMDQETGLKSSVRRPSQRMVFIDEGAMTPDSFGVHYRSVRWWDDPPARHNDGATVSWADGHSSYLQWKGAGDDRVRQSAHGLLWPRLSCQRLRKAQGPAGFTPGRLGQAWVLTIQQRRVEE